MSGDWIPISVDLDTREEVLLLASRLRRPRAEIVGSLVILWSWFSRETRDGRTRLDVRSLAAALRLPEAFLQALIDVGWLSRSSSGLAVNNWNRWLSNSAKARMGERVRKQIAKADGNRTDAGFRNFSGTFPELFRKVSGIQEEKNRIRDPPSSSSVSLNSNQLVGAGSENAATADDDDGGRTRCLAEKANQLVRCLFGDSQRRLRQAERLFILQLLLIEESIPEAQHVLRAAYEEVRASRPLQPLRYLRKVLENGLVEWRGLTDHDAKQQLQNWLATTFARASSLERRLCRSNESQKARA